MVENVHPALPICGLQSRLSIKSFVEICLNCSPELSLPLLHSQKLLRFYTFVLFVSFSESCRKIGYLQNSSWELTFKTKEIGERKYGTGKILTNLQQGQIWDSFKNHQIDNIINSIVWAGTKHCLNFKSGSALRPCLLLLSGQLKLKKFLKLPSILMSRSFIYEVMVTITWPLWWQAFFGRHDLSSAHSLRTDSRHNFKLSLIAIKKNRCWLPSFVFILLWCTLKTLGGNAIVKAVQPLYQICSLVVCNCHPRKVIFYSACCGMQKFASFLLTPCISSIFMTCPKKFTLSHTINEYQTPLTHRQAPQTFCSFRLWFNFRFLSDTSPFPLQYCSVPTKIPRGLWLFPASNFF